MIQKNKECFLCGTTRAMEKHHIFFGKANRAKSEKYKDICTVWLCAYHHRHSSQGVHFNKQYDLMLKQIAQEEFERAYSHELFIKEFGKSWL